MREFNTSTCTYTPCVIRLKYRVQGFDVVTGEPNGKWKSQSELPALLIRWVGLHEQIDPYPYVLVYKAKRWWRFQPHQLEVLSEDTKHQFGEESLVEWMRQWQEVFTSQQKKLPLVLEELGVQEWLTGSKARPLFEVLPCDSEKPGRIPDPKEC